jgi:peptide/nickel transport system ATP-binding protein
MSAPATVNEDGGLLAVRNLHKTFVSRSGLRTLRVQALHDVSFEVQRGEVLALIGESGSGKTTAARIIARLIEPSRGELWWKGRNVLTERRPTLSYRSQVQMIFQDPFASLNPVHTVGYHLERPLLRHGKATRAQLQDEVHALLETVGLRPAAEVARKFPHQLSGGQRQRVSVARALAVDPELILADEPTSMLDVSIRIDILNLMRGLKEQRGLAYLYITHDLGSARYLADRAVVMYAGHVVEAGPVGPLLDQPAHPYTRLLEAALSTGLGAGTPSPARPPSTSEGPATGCPFAARCPSVMDRCRRELPQLRKISTGALVRCHLYDG